ncbi:hypothetical protein [Gallintestinimicrobium sp.]|uniref:hypothetical protein n=1 Tax=Gallintestinimicrobium sp. TaxID=2981655 RepID=UPI00399374F0
MIWDITTVAWLLDERFMEDYLMPSPIPEYDGHYSVDPKRHLMRYVYHVNRDKVFRICLQSWRILAEEGQV